VASLASRRGRAALTFIGMGRHERIAELVRLDAPGLRVADLGAGAGRVVRAMLAVAPPAVRVHAVDTASSLEDDLLQDARVRSVLADLDEPLPFADGSLDRVVSLNAAEHLADPRAHLAQCHRVLAPGGLMVLAHSDWDTVLFAADDDDLTRVLVDRFVRAVPPWAERADGFMGRKLLALVADSPFNVAEVSTWADCHRRFDHGSVAWKVAMGMVAACQGDAALSERARAWVDGLGRRAAEGQFLFTVTDIAVVLRRTPAAGG
jgi:SAM-dependent methyltransferase